MFRTIKDINLAQLKQNHARLYYFGLGFIQLKLNDDERLHFYSPKLPAITEDIHNHRYGYISRILKGELTNSLYEYWEPEQGECETTHVMSNESCNADIKAPKLDMAVNIINSDAVTYHEGQSYVMLPSMYHTVKAKDCITYLIRTHKMGNFAQVILPKGKTGVCPFSKKIPEGELWEIMGEMLGATQVKSDVKLGSWPAFYESSPGNFLWIDFSGTVVNGGWRPTFSEDRLSCWHSSEHVFKWVGAAPSHGNYNDVIDAFRQSREDANG